ncbi:MAG: class I SAM-dependent methyltransferase [bacterium]
MTNQDICKKYYINLTNSYLKTFFSSNVNENIHKALESNIDIHMFKRSPRRLPRIVKTIGMLKQMNPSSVLEIGCGQGVFLWTLLNEFPHFTVRVLDIKSEHIDRVNNVAKNSNLDLFGYNMDIEKYYENYSNESYDIVTCLEVLEHIENWKKAIGIACHFCKNFVIFSFPSKEDDNPEHIHLLDKQKVSQEILKNSGMVKTKFDYVNGHIFIIGRKEM